MLVGSIVHPNENTVFPLVAEPIVNQDGARKNDCERNATKRVITRLCQDYTQHKLLVVADGLYSCGPILNQLIEAGHEFIITAKPGDHKALFTHFNTWSERGATKSLTIKEDSIEHCFEWANGLGLNETWAGMKINLLRYEQRSGSGKRLTFSWVTNRSLTKRNVQRIMRIGRSRWKIENETFNTLKNQGYQFEHNYGHGYEHLCSTLAHLMLLAFLTDQIMELASSTFRAILAVARTRVKVWFQQRALVTSMPCDSFRSIYGRLVELFGVQLI